MDTNDNDTTRIMKDDEATRLVATNTTVELQKQADEKAENKDSENDKKNQKLLKKIAAYTGSGILLGSASSIFLNLEAAEPIEMEEDGSDTVFDGQNSTGVETIGVSDEMSFNEAFLAARTALGSGAVFEWRGNIYATYTKEEWEAMNEGSKSEFLGHLEIDETEGSVDDYESGEEAITTFFDPISSTESTQETPQSYDDGADEIEVVTVGGMDIVASNTEDQEDEVIHVTPIGAQETLEVNVDGDSLFTQESTALDNDVNFEDEVIYTTPIDDLSDEGLAGIDSSNPDIDFYPGFPDDGPDYLAEL